jgi:DNA-binding NtrC family response regulator
VVVTLLDSQGASKAKKRILVVDDEDGFHEMVVVGLNKEGYETMQSDNGLNVFEPAKASVLNLIISDVTMYSGSGSILRDS